MTDAVVAQKLKTDKNAYKKEWYAANKEREKARRKEWRAANKECHSARSKKWYAANKEREKDRSKKYQVDNFDSLKAIRKAKYANNPGIYASRREWLRNLRGCVDCKFWPDWRVGLPHYDSHCYRCFSRKFPDHPKVRVKERAEDTVKAYINSHFVGFIHDHVMPTAHCVCDHRRRIDHRREVGNTLLCIETDEHHHRNYDKDDEDARYHDLLMGWGGKLCFVRFNPDGVKGPPLEERLELLHAEITRHIGRLERSENSLYLEVWHLYYPEGTSDYDEEALAPEGL